MAYYQNMRLAILLALASAAWGQVTLTLTGPATARQGQIVPLSLGSTGATANGPAGLQWTLTPPSGFAITGSAAGTQGTAAGKAVSCNAANTLCLLFGLNQNVIANGQAATLTVQVPANATPGAASFGLTGLVAGDKIGIAMTATAGTAYSLTVLSRADLNGDGVVNSADVSAMAAEVTSGACSADQNADGKCDMLDILLVILKALGF